jgi:hypothetical protein
MKLTDNYNGALQQPINSGFGSTSTVHDVIKGINLNGKTAIVTGGYAGIGLETVKAFVAAGAQVVVPARDIHKAAGNLKGVNNVTIEEMDLMDPESINAFAEKFLQMMPFISLLIMPVLCGCHCNVIAGVMNRSFLPTIWGIFN